MKPLPRATIRRVTRIITTADHIVSALAGHLGNVCILDSCGVASAEPSLLVAGIEPVEVLKLGGTDIDETLREFDAAMAKDGLAAIFTISYDLGPRLLGLPIPSVPTKDEPDLFIALFDTLLIHDHRTGETEILGDPKLSHRLAGMLKEHSASQIHFREPVEGAITARSNFTRAEYVKAVETIKESIRDGDTYQTNLTQKITVGPIQRLEPYNVFQRLRSDHPARFAAYLDRGETTVVSASPEQFVRIDSLNGGRIIASPIKGTRRRGTTPAEDDRLRKDLVESEKDRAENTMIVDLTRNDLGRICEFGSVEVAEHCQVEEHRSLFHLVSTVRGRLRPGLNHSDILRAVFPCGSITGAPKISTMKIIAELEPESRGLSMGAIGCSIPPGRFGISERFEMSVAIRTMVFNEDTVEFNVGGGIVIDSDPEQEYEESILKAKALLKALNAKPPRH
ncbi:MAG TPA: anthranilate synthase component I family protein [Pyrinomonadaceae bacterium]|nr:anthranilate synthase component I family protein [Pyrinomonadaceae bacterium]